MEEKSRLRERSLLARQEQEEECVRLEKECEILQLRVAIQAEAASHHGIAQDIGERVENMATATREMEHSNRHKLIRQCK